MTPKQLAKNLLPIQIREWLGRRATPWPPIGWLRFGSLRRLTPISRRFGLERGRCIDRYYIEKFLDRYAADIRGHAMEISSSTYTTRFGDGRVTKADVLHVQGGTPNATIVADLSAENQIHSDDFDCIILTQTLPFIFDARAAVRTLYRILKPGGVVLATLPGISQISRYDMERWGDYWRFTNLSAERLFGDIFGAQNVKVEAYGNVLVAAAFLYGLAAEELHPKELEARDADYQVVITVRAVKSLEQS
jgi:SAM-dependent methyltransferase